MELAGQERPWYCVLGLQVSSNTEYVMAHALDLGGMPASSVTYQQGSLGAVTACF
jgi:hypothetical protein